MAGLHGKDVFAGQSFATSKNWLALGGAVSPGLVRSQISNHWKRQKIKRHDYYSLLITYVDLKNIYVGLDEMVIILHFSFKFLWSYE